MSTSNPPPPGTPTPTAPRPAGPRPAPSGPPRRGIAEVIADGERLGAQLLTALDPDVVPARSVGWWFLNRARELVGDAMSVLGQIQTPARRDLSASNCAAPVATTGGPVERCVGKSLADGVPARCGETAVHGLHRVGPDAPPPWVAARRRAQVPAGFCLPRCWRGCCS